MRFRRNAVGPGLVPSRVREAREDRAIRLQPGQRVRCVKRGEWRLRGLFPLVGGPVFGGVYSASDIDVVTHPVTLERLEMVALAGFDGLWGAEHFTPIEDNELERLREVCAEASIKAAEPA